jgi:hypothetical protein
MESLHAINVTEAITSREIQNCITRVNFAHASIGDRSQPSETCSRRHREQVFGAVDSFSGVRATSVFLKMDSIP